MSDREALPIDFPEPIWVDYTNWKSKRDWRKVSVIEIQHTVSPEHSQHKQWYMHVLMHDRKGARRTLRMSDIHAVSFVPPTSLHDATKVCR